MLSHNFETSSNFQVFLRHAKVFALRVSPHTSYPLDNSNSARYEPSCPVIPVINAFFVMLPPVLSPMSYVWSLRLTSNLELVKLLLLPSSPVLFEHHPRIALPFHEYIYGLSFGFPPLYSIGIAFSSLLVMGFTLKPKSSRAV